MSQNSSDELIRLHSAGATVRHRGPFSNLEVPSSRDTLDGPFYEKWVVPFYIAFSGGLSRFEGEQLKKLQEIWSSIDQEIVSRLLEDFEWWTRTTGAYFAALKRMDQFEDQIGRLLLRSDVCFAGGAYCVALATFNSQVGVSYFTRYLDYYLGQPHLRFDQGFVFGALSYLDQKNGTDHATLFVPRWQVFTGNKTNYNPAGPGEWFRATMERVDELRAALVASSENGQA